MLKLFRILLLGFLSLTLSQIALAEKTIRFEFEVMEFSIGGKQWDSMSRYLGADPAPDIYGLIKTINGEVCEIKLFENTHIVRQDCRFSSEVKEGDKFSIEIFDKDVGRKDDLIFSGSVTFQENPTLVNEPPNSYLKSLKIEK